jgi:pimeloyl-ACP methyl ester carboxylesterase
MTTTKMQQTKTKTVPSIGSGSNRAGAATVTTSLFSNVGASEGANKIGVFRRGIRRFFNDIEEEMSFPAVPVVSPIDPYLHMFPKGLHTCYRPLPRLVQGLNVLLATWMAIVSTSWKKHQLPVSYFYWIRKAAMVLLKAAVYSLVTQIALQESIFKARLGPSRVSTQTLMQKYFLPTSLSKYEPIHMGSLGPPSLSGDKTSLGVHYLQYDNQEESDDAGRKFDAVYFQHGFGASSLSWLPVFPSLTKQLGANVALGHDAVGFGFTDRPTDPLWYTPLQSARIAQAILESKVSKTDAVCLVGHSMGSRSIVRLATRLPSETRKLIILSSPALGLLKSPPPGTAPKKPSRVVKSLLKPAFKWVLRKVVGTPNAWKKGLQGAWGNSSKVQEHSEVLRYSWPSIGSGWEDGLLRFAKAQMLPMENELDDDLVAFRKVLEDPNAQILIVLGSKDKVVPTLSVRAFLEKVRQSQPYREPVVVELDGLGHCAFEEDCETFCKTVEDLVAGHWDILT